MPPRTRQVTPLLVLALVAGFAARALADAPIALTVTPVSSRIRVDATCSAAGVAAASLNAAVNSTPGMTAQLQIDSALSGSQALVTVSGSGSGGAGTAYIDVFLEVDVDVPRVGDALTPVFVSLGTLSTTGALWSLRYAAIYGSRLAPVPDCSFTESAAPSSTQLGLGNQLGDPFNPYALFGGNLPAGEKVTRPVPLLAGDTVRIPLQLYIQLAHDPGTGAVTASVPVSFSATPVTIGNGDVNGDSLVNVLDTTLIRRAIAGFPNP